VSRVLIYHPRAWGRDRTAQQITCPIATTRATSICEHLTTDRGIAVHADVDTGCRVHLYADQPVTTRQEVAALAEFRAITDAPLVWHPYTGPPMAETLRGGA
jgi:hypothetical protein